jgi:hypothetical protein
MLHEKALLVTLSLSMFSPKKTDKGITKKVLAEHGAADGTLRVAKRLLPDEAVEPIRKLHSDTRDYHHKHTVAWSDDNERLLHSIHFLEYSDQMRRFHTQADQLAEEFVREYPHFIAEARIQLNGAFKASDYPAQSVIRDKFAFRCDYKPVPDGGDFRISVQREVMDELRASVDARVAEATNLARLDVARRLAEPLAAMVNRLSHPDAVFRDTLITNLRDICDLLPNLNITDDPTLESARQRILAELYQADADLLRENPTVRASTARKAQSILDTMTGYFGAASNP